MHEPCPIEIMKVRNRNDTICETLRAIYHMTKDEDIRLKCRIAVTMAKKMDAKLNEYKRDWDKGFWDA